MADVSRLPGPNADFWDWQLRGSCRGTDSDLFFHPEGERGQARTSREEAAKEVCLHCPVCKPCREHAMRVHEPYGVWGGMTEEEREEQYVRGEGGGAGGEARGAGREEREAGAQARGEGAGEGSGEGLRGAGHRAERRAEQRDDHDAAGERGGGGRGAGEGGEGEDQAVGLQQNA
ncbi:MAG: WhiB family transcriptional regulator [Catenulisporales bacterium]|nr:WhiB family transcriptional regulator [Catenulisporales bacterium]